LEADLFGSTARSGGCRAATRLNNDAVTVASQDPHHRKSRKLYRTARAHNISIDTSEHIGSRLRDSFAMARFATIKRNTPKLR
jgi:hypothetical protein